MRSLLRWLEAIDSGTGGLRRAMMRAGAALIDSHMHSSVSHLALSVELQRALARAPPGSIGTLYDLQTLTLLGKIDAGWTGRAAPKAH